MGFCTRLVLMVLPTVAVPCCGIANVEDKQRSEEACTKYSVTMSGEWINNCGEPTSEIAGKWRSSVRCDLNYGGISYNELRIDQQKGCQFALDEAPVWSAVCALHKWPSGDRYLIILENEDSGSNQNGWPEFFKYRQMDEPVLADSHCKLTQ